MLQGRENKGSAMFPQVAFTEVHTMQKLSIIPKNAPSPHVYWSRLGKSVMHSSGWQSDLISQFYAHIP